MLRITLDDGPRSPEGSLKVPKKQVEVQSKEQN